MPKKPKFKPVITRVKLNPEQAVLSCTCYSGGVQPGWGYVRGEGAWTWMTMCSGRSTYQYHTQSTWVADPALNQHPYSGATSS